MIPLLFVLTLSSCAKTPPNLLAENEQVTAEKPNGSLETFEMLTLSEIAERKTDLIHSIRQQEYDNIIFSEKNDLNIPDEVFERKIMIIDNFQDRWDAIYDKYIPEKIKERAEVINDERYYPVGPYLSDESSDFYCSVGCTGFFSLNSMSSVLNQIPYSVDAEETFFADNPMYDTLSHSAEIFASELSETAGYFSDFRANSISTYKIEGYGKFYYVKLDCCLNGVGILDAIDKYNESGLELPFSSISSAILDENGKVQAFTVQADFEEYGEKAKIDKIISPKTAADIISDKLSGRITYNVEAMKLMYVPKFLENVQQVKDGEKTQQENNPWATFFSYNVYTLSPYWVFIFDAETGKEILGLVNCTDGTATLINNQ